MVEERAPAVMRKPESLCDSGSSRSWQVCEGCRSRKVRCDPGKEGCQNCIGAGVVCIRRPAFRFQNDTRKRSLQFAPHQVWALPTVQLRYHDETPSLAEFYGGNATSAHKNPCPPPDENGDQSARPLTVGAHAQSQHSVRADDNIQGSGSARGAGLDWSSATSRHDDLGSFMSPGAGSTTFGDQDSSMDWPVHQSPWADLSLTSEASMQPNAASVPSLSEAEAVLLRHYMERMAPWADGPDTHRSFEVEASRIALTDPVLRYAICAFASRHIHRHHDDRDAMALEYQDSCLRLLIPAISEEQPISEGILAAVAILRQNEELDEYDNRFHLEGVTRILNGASAFASSGGLREATAWLCLREDIYVSLISQTPVRTNLAPFKHATWIQSASDSSWTNRMVLLLAELLSLIFHEQAADSTALTNIKRRILDWDQTKPFSFNPVHFVPRDAGTGRFLPEIWMLTSVHAVGLQYNHIARLILAVSGQASSSRPFDHIHRHRTIEKQVRQHLMYIVGIAHSNQRAQNTWFTAHHCLAVWGGCLRTRGDQRACLDFLDEMEREIGWRVYRLTERLKLQWEDDDTD